MSKIFVSLATFTAFAFLIIAATLATPAKAHAVQIPDAVNAATTSFAADCDGGGFLGLPAWYEGLTVGSDCNVEAPSGDITKFITILSFNIIRIGLMAVAYIAIGFILYGGFKFLTAEGESEKMVGARRTIINAVIGLIISICSVALVKFVSSNIGGAGNPNDWGIYTLSSDSIVKGVLNIFYTASAITAVIVIVISGYYFVTSGDNQTNITKARFMIQYAAIGLVAIAGAFILTNFVLGRMQ